MKKFLLALEAIVVGLCVTLAFNKLLLDPYELSIFWSIPFWIVVSLIVFLCVRRIKKGLVIHFVMLIFIVVMLIYIPMFVPWYARQAQLSHTL